MSKIKIISKAQAAALIVKNAKVDRLNSFYLYHKEIIDEFQKLQSEVQEALGNYVTATTNSLLDKFPPKSKPIN